ncbi:MAG: hypothetical protein WB729_24310 [Candidatus Sulfotelmatobacter sp.]
MPSITTLLHTFNHGLMLGRALETLYPCDEILIVDHGSYDDTVRVAHEYGARVISLPPDALPSSWLQAASSDWILCLEPRESLTEALAASLYEWKLDEAGEGTRARACSLSLREETATGWRNLPNRETRLVEKNWSQWRGWLPAYDPSAKMLDGPVLRFMRPADVLQSLSGKGLV